jgi:hypothetical protein
MPERCSGLAYPAGPGRGVAQAVSQSPRPWPRPVPRSRWTTPRPAATRPRLRSARPVPRGAPDGARRRQHRRGTTSTATSARPRRCVALSRDVRGPERFTSRGTAHLNARKWPLRLLVSKGLGFSPAESVSCCSWCSTPSSMPKPSTGCSSSKPKAACGPAPCARAGPYDRTRPEIRMKPGAQFGMGCGSRSAVPV